MEAFHALGIKTTLLELADQVMTPVDREMAGFAHEEIRNKGIDLRLGVALEGVEFIPSESVANVNAGEKVAHQHLYGHLTLSLNNGEKLDTELLIMAIGVRPETALAKQAGLEIGELGGIKVDAQMQTNDPAIYAVGDAIEEQDFVTGAQTVVPLAGPANRQGRMAADNMLGRHQSYQGTQGTAICKIFDMAIASTGKNEKQLKRDGMTVEQLQHLELTYAPPFGSAKDVINQAAFVAQNIIIGDVKAIHFDEIDDLTDQQILLDVRNPSELEATGCIGEALNIPVDQLRQRMHELPKDKEIIIYCQVGLRGNVAYRQLVNNGYKARNLIGGCRTYNYAKA